MPDYATFAELTRHLPNVLPDLIETVQQVKNRKFDTILVLDDDPTGTQTVYDLPVITSWQEGEIEQELVAGTPTCYLLTNSRSLPEPEAYFLGLRLGQKIHAAQQATNKRTLVISRGDSTLRGHYPSEVLALEDGSGQRGVHFIIPAFFEGGRYTIGNVHYVRQGEQMIPANETPFAQDKAFGYQHADLRKWVEEKTGGAVPVDFVASISITDIRTRSVEALTHQIDTLSPGDVCIVNAAEYSDLQQFAAALLQSQVNPICRTAASFVAAIDAKPSKPLLRPKDLGLNSAHGGLVMVGSYVPKSSEQLAHLRAHADLVEFEIDVPAMIEGNHPTSKEVSEQIESHIRQGQSVLVFTSRKLIHADTPEESLAIGNRVSDFLTQLVSNLTVAPGFLLAKGGITSSDIATRALNVKRGWAKGQVIPGVPVWELGPETRFPGMPYLIFPGNVGQTESITHILQSLLPAVPTNPS
ncbi:four-carbon acid sugar kinase family protein [Pontibacter sp. G13]|uniref:four-carbon acid sugar kinase family protein n=1 Tax=Pontibacter sp. G13 TaxID=3074898 RepID=UPI00288BA9BF|nr:four-carbon acid sugar kinase family protein [Pontibacter sp. G13]WNJ17859.1 four-carbon acid sugar kinase family protein [Pontibacter sp. G13]